MVDSSVGFLYTSFPVHLVIYLRESIRSGDDALSSVMVGSSVGFLYTSFPVHLVVYLRESIRAIELLPHLIIERMVKHLPELLTG